MKSLSLLSPQDLEDKVRVYPQQLISYPASAELTVDAEFVTEYAYTLWVMEREQREVYCALAGYTLLSEQETELLHQQLLEGPQKDQVVTYGRCLEIKTRPRDRHEHVFVGIQYWVSAQDWELFKEYCRKK